MSSVMSMALNPSSVFHAPVARPLASFYCGVRVEFSPACKTMESYSFGKSTTSKKLKSVVATALNQYSDSPVEKFRHDASSDILTDVWGDFFLAYEDMTYPKSYPPCVSYYLMHNMRVQGAIPGPEEQENELERLRQEITMMLKTTPDGSILKLDLIDNVQRLGVSYHFKDEIESSLTNLYNSYHEETQNDLHTAALCYRFLRHQGHCVSADVLKKFTNHEGEFDEKTLANDVHGLLSLYEASYYAVHRENLLDEALRFSTCTLERIANNAGGLVANKINLALTWPIRKTLNRVMAKEYISLYQQDDSHNEVLLKFAKLDFNRMQRVYQKELCAATKWWKRLDCAKNYPFKRQRLVENYFCVAGMCFEPEYWLERKVLNIFTNLFSIIDDIVDEYGTVDDLPLLKDAIERWNFDAVNQLPPYIRPFFLFLLKSYSELEEELGKHGDAGHLEYIKVEGKAYMECSCNAYRDRSGYIPTFEEYMDNGVISVGVYVMLTASYIGKGDLVTKEVLDCAITWPSVSRAAAAIARLDDDLSDHSETGGTTAVECFMNQYGLSRKEAVEEVKKELSKAWKDFNSGCLLPASVPLTILERSLCYARLMFCLYRFGDGYMVHDSKHTQLYKSVLVDPII